MFLAETHHVRQNIIMLVVGLVPICAVAKQSRPTTKNGCLGVLCRPFCLQPRYYGLPSLLKFDGPTSPGANYEKYDFSENRKVQNPPGWWVFLLTGYKASEQRFYPTVPAPNEAPAIYLAPLFISEQPLYRAN